MGNKPTAPPPSDFRIERVKRTFKIPDEKLEVLWAIFLRYDKDKRGRIMFEVLMSEILQYRPNPLTEFMLTLINSSQEGSLTYGEFVEVVCTFCSFGELELMRYIFYILDPKQTGLVKKDELKHIIYKMNYCEENANMREAFQFLDLLDENNSLGTFNFKQLLMLKNKYPNIFHPLYYLQTQYKTKTLGEYWWNMHLMRLQDEKEELIKEEQRRLRKDALEKDRQEEMLQEKLLLRRMGPMKYYGMPWLRGKERLRLQRIAAIEQEFEAKLDA